MSEVRGRSREDPMPKGQQPKGAAPHLRSGRLPRVPGCGGAGAAESSRLRQCRSSPEELPYVQGAVAAWAQEGLEELFHVQGQEGQQ